MPLSTMPGHLIRRLHQISTAAFAEGLRRKGVDMTSVQFAALHTIHGHPGIDQATLAQLIAYDRATIGGVVDRLVRKGWVTREVNKDDRRARRLSLTHEGITTLADVSPVIETLQTDILAALTPEERARFIALAAKAVGNVDGFDPSV